MVIEDRRREFGLLMKQFREHRLELTISEFSRLTQMNRTEIYGIENGSKVFLDINSLCFLLDIGFSMHALKNDNTKGKVDDYLELERFKKRLNHHQSQKLRFQFEMFCELNKEHIEKNYVSGVLEQFKS